MEKDNLTETIESILNNFINGNLSDCKSQIRELGAESAMALVYVTLQVSLLVGDDFTRWVSKNLGMTK